MTLYIKIDRTTGLEIERRDFASDPGRALHKPQVWLPLIASPRPSYDDTTHSLSAAPIILPNLSDLSIPVPQHDIASHGWTTTPIPPKPAPATTPTTLEDLERAVIALSPARASALAAIAAAKSARGTPL